MNAEAGRRPLPDPTRPGPIRPGPTPHPSLPARLVLPVAVAAAAALLAAIPGGGTAAADPDLATLLRFMAATKAALAVGAVAALVARLGSGPPPRPAARLGWLGAIGLMAAGAVLIARVGPAAAGAVSFHAGLGLLAATLLWLDRDGIAAALAARLARRRGRRL